jgi:ABC-2 type transport system ATP-binding protein
VTDTLGTALSAAGFKVIGRGTNTVVEIEGEARVAEVLALALANAARVVEVTSKRETLEDLFMRRAL